ncbi:Mob1/phocein [Xylariaceae sp. FL1019]|nr:Mob1/phocein [Xylariaceae sp. FL1019]
MSLAQGSPRLPSPPPPAEIQLGPESPGLGRTQEMEQTIADANAKRRIHPGTKAEDMAAGPPLVPLNELDSAFQLQEHLAALHWHHTAHNTIPITRQTAAHITQPPPGVDRTMWLYELCRFLIAQCNGLIVGFLFDSPPCSSATCPEMRASEWQFLCAVHEQPKSCCAIDYCCHTLDWAANIVTNPKIFPSRFVLVSEGVDKSAVLKNLINVFRRLHRIFAHAWFQHRGVFWSVESQTGLYAFFKTVCDMYDLLPAENYKLPPEAEGLEPEPSSKDEKRQVTAIAKPPPNHSDSSEHDDDRAGMQARRTNTARHASRPSTGSAVTTVIEEREDECTEVTDKMRGMHISNAPELVGEESGVEVPVIVESGMMEEPTPTTAQPPTDPASKRDTAHTEDSAEQSDGSSDTPLLGQDTPNSGDSDSASGDEEDGPPSTAVQDFAEPSSASSETTDDAKEKPTESEDKE